MKRFSLLLLAVFTLFSDTSCDAQECNFATLAKSLISDDNLYELSRNFFPPVKNSPEFVEVTYTFTETSQTQTWYWSEPVSSFIHPPEVLQLMSLLFIKAHKFFSGNIQLALAPVDNLSISECAKDLEKMQLLTQRVSCVTEMPSDQNYYW